MHTVCIPDLETPKCRSCGELLFSDSADEQINAALRSHLKLLTPSQIRRRRKQLGLNQGELAAKIGAAEGTISRWETGALIQSRTSDNLLRVYFALPAVRAVLVGEGQDPDLGLEDKRTAESAQGEMEAGRYAEFTYAAAAYGEERLSAEITCFREIGSLLPVGRD
jgi:putative zinc finger/helix-turn-helix YgiT family protein